MLQLLMKYFPHRLGPFLWSTGFHPVAGKNSQIQEVDYAVSGYRSDISGWCAPGLQLLQN